MTVLMGFIHCQASRTLSGLLREIAVLVTVGGLSRFLIDPAWSMDEVAKARYALGERAQLIVSPATDWRLAVQT